MTGIIAHRGYSSKYPENTMLAFKKAADFPIRGIELDLQVSKCGQLVICHDEKIDRTSNGQGFVKDMTLDQLKSYDFSYKFSQYRGQEDCKIPSLEEFFTWFKDQDIMVNLELKTNIISYPTIIEETLELIKTFDLRGRVIISSFNHHSVMEVKAMETRISCGFLNANSIYKPGSYCKGHGIEYYHPSYLGLQEEDMEDLREASVGVNVYTVDDPEIMIGLAKWGVDNIITNKVDLACQTLNK